MEESKTTDGASGKATEEIAQKEEAEEDKTAEEQNTAEETKEETEVSMQVTNWSDEKLKFTLVGATYGDNDAAAWGGYLFKFNGKGQCHVYSLDEFSKEEGDRWRSTGEKTHRLAVFYLDRTAEIAPHSNAVFFGTEKYSPEDEFPLLYCNVYNNYKENADQRRGTLCAYRILRKGNAFTSQLVQLIQVGFTDDKDLWCSETGDVRPYGNFALDRESNTLYAFTMRDGDKSTRHFAFPMPKVTQGEAEAQTGVKKVILQREDILSWFSCDWQHYVQGAEVYDGLIFSAEGRTDSSSHPAALRIIDPESQKEVRYVLLAYYVQNIEPEVITFWDGKCYYGDVRGNLYLVESAE